MKCTCEYCNNHGYKNTLTNQWHNTLQEWYSKNMHRKDLPPCPKCKGKMERWDAWLVTGETCKECGWGDSEGFAG